MKKIKFFKAICWIFIIAILITSCILCLIGGNSKSSIIQSVLLSIGTGLGASAVISLLFYGVQCLQDKEKAKIMREMYLPNIKMLVYLFISHTSLEKYHNVSKESLLEFLENESKAINNLTKDDEIKLFESVSQTIYHEGFELMTSTIQSKLDILLQTSAISTSEYKHLTFAFFNIILTKNRIQQENFEEAKSCYADLFISIKELIINTSEISVIKDLIIEGASFKYLNPRDGLTTAEKQLILMFIGSK